MILYTYWRSSAAFRVRIALNLKGLKPELRFVHLTRDGGQQHSVEYRGLNPQGRVPYLIDGSLGVGQSSAIIEYLEETHPEPPLLPRDAAGRARVRAIAALVACDIHPLQNLTVGKELETRFGADQAAKDAWVSRFIALGFGALETQLARDPATGRFCHGDAPTLADCMLVPQVLSARRFKLDLAPYPTLTRIDAECMKLAAFADAAPARQPDAE